MEMTLLSSQESIASAAALAQLKVTSLPLEAKGSVAPRATML